MISKYQTTEWCDKTISEGTGNTSTGIHSTMNQVPTSSRDLGLECSVFDLSLYFTEDQFIALNTKKNANAKGYCLGTQRVKYTVGNPFGVINIVQKIKS